MDDFDRLARDFQDRRLTRRLFLRRAVILGASASAVIPVLAACSSQAVTGSAAPTAGSAAPTGGATATPEASRDLVLGFSLGTLAQRRWQFDRQYVEEAAKPLGMSVLVQAAEDNETLQISQVENLVGQGIDALILSPINVETAAPAVALARQAGIPVISYNSIVRNAEISYWVSRDNSELGRVQADAAVAAMPKGKYVVVSGESGNDVAQEVTQAILDTLKPSIDSGSIELVSQEFHRAWDPALGLAQVEQALSRTGNKLDAILCNYDGFVLAILPALEAAGLLGKTWIGGNDVFLEVAQAIAQGNANESGYTDLKDMATKAVAAAHALAMGESPESDDTINNGAGDVPGSRIRSFAVTKDNMCQFLKDTGWLESAEVYANVAGGPPC